MLRVLVVGSGGREHALAWACRQSSLPQEVICAPGNPGTAAIADNVGVRADDVAALVRLAQERQVELVVIGPDAAVAAGLGDACEEAGIACFGPSRAAGRVEASKVAAKRLMESVGIRTARWVSGGAADRAMLDGFVAELGGACVVKADGLALGKGVSVCDTAAEAAAALDALLVERRFGDAGATVVVEERLRGEEVSVLALTDGVAVRLLPLSRDYKRAADGDRGPNTGGMGACSPPPRGDEAELLEQVAAEVMQPAVDALRESGTPYRGCLYAGLMLTDSGIHVLEFNARLGDPEAQVVLPRVAEDMVELMGACAVGGLDAGRVRTHHGACVGVVAASAGYPETPVTGATIEGLEEVDRHALVFHAGTARHTDGRLVTSGGRVLTVVGRGHDVDAARRHAYENLDRIHFEGMRCRRDVGAAGSHG